MAEGTRSHTLVFEQLNVARSKAVTEALRKEHRIKVDSWKTFVRIGFGFNHHSGDVDTLVAAVASGL